MCLYVQSKYKEAFRNLRDGLGGTQALSSFPSVSSLHTSDQSSFKEKDSAPPKSKQTAYRRTNNDSKNHGILMSEEDVIFGHMDAFCTRAKNMLDQMSILSQYQTLAKTTLGLSRPKREDLGFGDNDAEEAEEDDNTSEDLNDSDDDLNDAESFNEIHADSVMGFSNKNAKNMDPVVEEEADEEFSRENSSVKFETTRKQPRKSSTKAKKQINDSISELNITKTTTDKTQHTATQDNETYPLSEYRNDAAEELFKTENRIEEDTQRILKKTQTLSKEDLRVLRKLFFKRLTEFSFLHNSLN